MAMADEVRLARWRRAAEKLHRADPVIESQMLDDIEKIAEATERMAQARDSLNNCDDAPTQVG
jgi:hypothetical protein